MGRILLSALFVAPLAVGCGRQSGLDAASKLRQQLNASSPLTLADLQDKLRQGMLIEEFDQVVAERNEGPNKSTKVGSHALIEGDPPKANPKKGVRTYFLKDANLIVVTEFVGDEDKPQEQVVSWRTEPLQKD